MLLRPSEPIEVQPSNAMGWFDRFAGQVAGLRPLLEQSLKMLHEWVHMGDPWKDMP